MKILKYKVPLQETFSIDIPTDGLILAVQTQRNKPYIWVQVGTALSSKRNFRLLNTGEMFDVVSSEEKYIGTFQLDGGAFIGHLFEL